ncbi:MAG: DUF4148 domain-containing protein [Burkholderiales bacterium]|nr:DUF4148 domain-containing protein [Burkholderiales bacterium]
MNFAKYTAFAIAATAALALPTISSASSMWHASNGEAGVTYYPEHFKSTKTRAQVSDETVAARKDGTLDQLQTQYQLNAPVPAKGAGPGKTRQQVVAELNSETADERRARTNLLAGS